MNAESLMVGCAVLSDTTRNLESREPVTCRRCCAEWNHKSRLVLLPQGQTKDWIVGKLGMKQMKLQGYICGNPSGLHNSYREHYT